MNAATNQPSILTFRLGQSDRAGHVCVWSQMADINVFRKLSCARCAKRCVL